MIALLAQVVEENHDVQSIRTILYPYIGEILVGDVPIHDLSLESWRRQIGYVSQKAQ